MVAARWILLRVVSARTNRPRSPGYNVPLRNVRKKERPDDRT